MVENNVETKTIFKIFFAWQENKEEKWLREMSKEGWHLYRVGFFNYGFKIGWVGDYVSIYRIHSKQMHKSKEKAKHNDRLQREVLALIKKRASNLSDVMMLDDLE